MHDHYSQIRPRQARDASQATLRPTGRGPGQFPAFVGRVFAGPKLPTSMNQYYSVHPVAILGTEAEGSVATLVPDTTATVLVCVVGTATPAVGDDLICRFSGNRWVAERFGGGSGGGGGPVNIPGCACPAIPATLTLTVSGPCGGVFQPCTIVYGPTPSYLSAIVGSIGTSCFLSTTSYIDSYSGRPYQWYFTCNSIFMQLRRVFTDSGGFLDTTLYSWSIGQPGNTCKGVPLSTSPFLLSNGMIYPGGSPYCLVDVTG